jgi:phage FluMu protein Com
MQDMLMLDANAVAGDLAELFGFDMTAAVHRCAHCGNVGAMGTLLAWTHGPGVTLRCCICRDVVVRIVRTPSRTLIDVSGAAYLEIRPA